MNDQDAAAVKTAWVIVLLMLAASWAPALANDSSYYDAVDSDYYRPTEAENYGSAGSAYYGPAWTSPQPATRPLAAQSLHPTEFPSVPERPVLAVDVDETLSVTDYQHLMWGIGHDDGRPLPGAQATLSRLSATFDIVYVTARSRSMKGKTERWLARHGFPAGRLVTAPTLGDFIFQGDFKQRIIRKLRNEYPNLVVGIGDKAKDGKAYRESGMISVIVNPWSDHKYHPNDVVLRDWSAVSEFFQANHELLSNPRRLNQDLSRGRLRLDLSSAREYRGQS
ncbi:MAG TPA: hypothetical protein PLQ89_09915 [Phycisphaerae bacterium]|nr:hypothetical protein [Phycisphaerae bacterium]